MRNYFSKILAASFALALAFTLSCSDDNDDGGNQSSNSNGGISSPSSSSNAGGNLSSGSSSSVRISSSSVGSSSSSSKAESVPLLPCVQGEVTIGTQVWQKCNLDIVPTGENGAATNSACYDNDPANCTIYGRLYDWSTAMALPESCNKDYCTSQINDKHQGICPNGWHIPSDADWDALLIAVGDSAGTKYIAGTKLKATNGWIWNEHVGDGNGTDDYGFSALPGGRFDNNDKRFYDIGERGNLCSTVESSATRDRSYVRRLRNIDKYMYREERFAKSYFRSVRCVKD